MCLIICYLHFLRAVDEDKADRWQNSVACSSANSALGYRNEITALRHRRLVAAVPLPVSCGGFVYLCQRLL